MLGRTVSRLRVPNEYANSNFMSSGNRNITFPSCNHLAICTQFIHTHTYTSIWFPVPCREFQFASCTCIDCGQFGWQAVSEPSCLRRSVPPEYGGLYKTLQLFHNSRRLLCFLNCNFLCVLTSRRISIIQDTKPRKVDNISVIVSHSTNFHVWRFRNTIPYHKSKPFFSQFSLQFPARMNN